MTRTLRALAVLLTAMFVFAACGGGGSTASPAASTGGGGGGSSPAASTGGGSGAPSGSAAAGGSAAPAGSGTATGGTLNVLSLWGGSEEAAFKDVLAAF